MKERLGLTEIRKQANRMSFGEIEEDAYQEHLGFSLGHLGPPNPIFPPFNAVLTPSNSIFPPLAPFSPSQTPFFPHFFPFSPLLTPFSPQIKEEA
ncbi:merozoite surface protein CMZ-8-like [Cyanistes caeruleus]|uniref:merozoite surface protein CMZ-8-like n=1 Tax=Cyanistes caeruleus TaxID=156563 RepID=UPI000CDA057D|nr:merozoite surface protein CMZ-8-like [Cyanistes caeruleus]